MTAMTPPMPDRSQSGLPEYIWLYFSDTAPPLSMAERSPSLSRPRLRRECAPHGIAGTVSVRVVDLEAVAASFSICWRRSVRAGADGARGLVMARWGMPSPPKLVTGIDRGVTNIRRRHIPDSAFSRGQGHFRPGSAGFARWPLLLRPKSRHSASAREPAPNAH